MREPYGEGVASHTDPESCACGREAASEALIGECVQAEHMAAPTSEASEVFSCQLGAVHTWHSASDKGRPIMRQSGSKMG